MSDKKISGLDLSKELKLLEDELLENEKIYSQVKVHYDKMLKASNPASRFITEQTANLMNIRNSRITIIKEMIGVKRAEADMELKEFNATKADEGSDGAIQETAKQVYNYLMRDNSKNNIDEFLSNKAINNSSSNNTDNNESSYDEDEDLLEKRMQEIKQAREKAENKEKEEIPYMIACDMDKNLYAITLDGTEILNDIKIPDMNIEFVKDEITGEVSAMDENGNEIIIIEIE